MLCNFSRNKKCLWLSLQNKWEKPIRVASFKLTGHMSSAWKPTVFLMCLCSAKFALCRPMSSSPADDHDVVEREKGCNRGEVNEVHYAIHCGCTIIVNTWSREDDFFVRTCFTCTAACDGFVLCVSLNCPYVVPCTVNPLLPSGDWQGCCCCWCSW